MNSLSIHSTIYASLNSVQFVQMISNITSGIIQIYTRIHKNLKESLFPNFQKVSNIEK